MATIDPVLQSSNSLSLDDGNGDSARNPSRSSSRRVSKEEYYYNQLADQPRQSAPPTSDSFDSPPSYDVAVKGLRLPKSQLSVMPREDEGREQLPSYSCSIMIRSVFVKKMELECAVHRARDRSWYKVFADLQGTALRFYKVKGTGLFSKDQGGAIDSPDLPPWVRPGELLKTYSLLYADVGIAADYEKRRYVIRVRVEDDQFLLSCIEIKTFLLWLESLSAAIDLAPPLDDRKLPRDLSTPRARRRRRRPGRENLQATESLVRQQREIIRTQYPHLAETIPEETAGPARSEPSARRCITPRSDLLTVMRRPAPALPQPELLQNLGLGERLEIERAPAAAALPTVASPSSAAAVRRVSVSSCPNPSVSPEGKWRPVHQWSPMYDLVYTRRCMAILLSNAPRKTNFIIIRGTQWIIDWATGAVERWNPPGYGEIERASPWDGSLGAIFSRI